MTPGHPHIPMPHFDHDAKALQAHANQNHRNALGLNEDLGYLGRRLWTALRRPARLAARLVGRSRG